MTTTEYAVTAFIILMAVFGIVEAIRTPMIVRRFYRDKSFVDNGKSTLDEVSDSVVPVSYTHLTLPTTPYV